MANSTMFHRSGSRATKQELCPYRSAGHNDVRAGRGYPDEYDSWSEKSQRAYENGRLVAVNILAAGMILPVWHAGVVRPRGLPGMTRHAANVIGTATNLRPMPSDPSLDMPAHDECQLY